MKRLTQNNPDGKSDKNATSNNKHTGVREQTLARNARVAPMNGDELIDLCYSSDEDSQTKQTASIRWEPDCLDDDNDDGCMIVEPPKKSMVATATTVTTSNASESDDIEILGATGPNALSDFPHSRQDCVTHPLARATAILFCKNCYCFVCDVKAPECHLWSNHCHAKKEDLLWEKRREMARRQRELKEQLVRVDTFSSCLGAQLWEKRQMARRQRELKEQLVTQQAARVQSLLKKVAKNFPHEALPPTTFITPLRWYQKQSLAFMKAQEAIQSFPTGGWLASDIGMGKTAIVLALVASDAEQQQDGTITTVVLTSVSLMGQWEDEAKKHAPGLSIRCFHPPSRSRVALDLRIIRDVDIIISTATFEWPRHVTDHVEFHRVVMDEAHLLSNTSTANLSWAMKLRAKRRWCVTATPCTSSILDLKLQMKFLEIKNNTPLSDAFQKLVDSGSNDTAQSNNDAAFDTFVQLFSNFVTRHEKSQLVGGTEALALPSKVCKVVTLKMSCQEKTQFQENLRKVNKRLIQNYQRFGGMSFVLEETLIRPLSSDNLFTSWNQSTKIIALLQEMKSLQQRDSNLRAVVFTHYSKTQTDVVQALKSFFGIPVVYEIRLSTPAKDRDFALRVFQGPRTFPACIVVMLRSFVTLPFVGMALTQASHLYLMEPSLDPAAEIAMGRIHRLGQEREIEMKKFVLAETVEANMVALHKEIENGRIQMPNRNVSADAVKVLTRGFSI